MGADVKRQLNLDGGVKKSSGVNVLPIVAETWAKVRDDTNTEVGWLIASFDGNSKTDITILTSGSGGVAVSTLQERCVILCRVSMCTIL